MAAQGGRKLSQSPRVPQLACATRRGAAAFPPTCFFLETHLRSFFMPPIARLMIAAVVLIPAAGLPAAGPAVPWPAVTLAPAREVTLAGRWAKPLQRGVARLAKPPYTEPWLRADVSFEINADLHQLQRRRLRPVPRTGQLDQPAGPALAADPGPAAEDGRRVFRSRTAISAPRWISPSRWRRTRRRSPCCGATPACWSAW